MIKSDKMVHFTKREQNMMPKQQRQGDNGKDKTNFKRKSSRTKTGNKQVL